MKTGNEMKVYKSEEKIDGYFNGVPFRIQEFDEVFHGEHRIDISFDQLGLYKYLEPLDKLVWLFIRQYSDYNREDGAFIYLFHVNPMQIADVLGYDVFDVDISLNKLVTFGIIKSFSYKGENHFYTVEHNQDNLMESIVKSSDI